MGLLQLLRVSLLVGVAAGAAASSRASPLGLASPGKARGGGVASSRSQRVPVLRRLAGGASGSAFSTLPPIALAAVTTGALMYPIDLLRALKMTSGGDTPIGQLVAEFRAAHGLKGFLTQGLGPELTKSTISRSLKFFCYPVAHRRITGGKNPSEGTMLTKAAAGVLATIPETLVILPLEVAKLTLQLDKQGVFSNSAGAVMRHLVTTRGPGALFVGLIGVQIRQALWTGTYFSTVSTCTRLCKEGALRMGFEEDSFAASSLASFLGGFGAGVLGVIANNPADVTRSIVQKKAIQSIALANGGPGTLNGPTGLSAIVGAGSEIVAKRGLGGLYAGFAFKSMHLGGSGALMNFLLPVFRKALRVEVE
uniref:Mitochondrial carrier protein n=1 Tax=Rhizochromulina marina TaxID=1034831 RepID=A0A7S2SVM0_9STRA|mmetsp:Transcript_954/g.3134  ORF Transcript_954/g.3134 Transcript_954/m.3134 type:complete len:366 (+) Transcript_954:82-1179(+)